MGPRGKLQSLEIGEAMADNQPITGATRLKVNYGEMGSFASKVDLGMHHASIQ